MSCLYLFVKSRCKNICSKNISCLRADSTLACTILHSLKALTKTKMTYLSIVMVPCKDKKTIISAGARTWPTCIHQAVWISFGIPLSEWRKDYLRIFIYFNIILHMLRCLIWSFIDPKDCFVHRLFTKMSTPYREQKRVIQRKKGMATFVQWQMLHYCQGYI